MTNDCFSQPDFNSVIGERLKTSPVFTNPSNPPVDKITILNDNYTFDELPIITYDIDKASLVPSEVILQSHKFPNCTSAEQTLNEGYDLTITLRKQVVLTNTSVSSNKFSFGIKIPIYGAVISMSDEVMTSNTLSQSSTNEQTVTQKFSRSLPFKIPAKKTTYVKIVAKRGVIRVPFNASFKINGNVHVEVIVNSFGIKLATWYNLSDLLSPEARSFQFSGYVTNENSSDLTVKYAETAVDPNDCLISSNIHNPTDVVQRSDALKAITKNITPVNTNIKKIPVQHNIQGIIYKTLTKIRVSDKPKPQPKPKKNK
jgi:hypothetical protein